MELKTIVVLEGDQTGQELLEESLRVLSPNVIGLEVELPRFDLSLERRRATSNGVVHEAAAAIREHGLGLKAATVTPEARGDVGSPNRILREEIGGKVIIRTGRRIPEWCRSAASTRPSLWCGWPLAMPTARRNGARVKATQRSRSGPSGSSVMSAVRSQSRVPRSGTHRSEGLRRPEIHGLADL